MKKLCLILSVVLFSICCVGCNNKNSSVVADAAGNTVNGSPVEAQSFIVGFDAEYPPYGYLSDDGKSYEGFDLDLAREFCKRTGMEFVAKPIDWDSKDLELNSGNIDCIWNGFTINGREDSYTWSVPYVDNSIVLIVKTDSNINNKSDLAGKIVMTQAGSSALAALTDEENEENVELVKTFQSLEQCPEYNTAFMNLESGIVDCVAVDIGVAKYQFKNSKGKFKQLDDTVSSEKYGVGFKKGNTELKDKVENVMFEMYKDGTFMSIADKYSDYSIGDSVCLGDYVK